MAKRDPRISWHIEEYIHRKKNPDWYWALGIIAVAGAAIAIIYHDTLFAIFIALSGIILGFFAARPPALIEVAISDEGIRIRNYLYPFRNLKSFSIDENDSGNHLLVESNRAVTPVISIRLPATLDTEALGNLLRTKIPEKHMKEHFSHRLMEHLGF